MIKANLWMSDNDIISQVLQCCVMAA